MNMLISEALCLLLCLLMYGPKANSAYGHTIQSVMQYGESQAMKSEFRDAIQRNLRTKRRIKEFCDSHAGQNRGLRRRVQDAAKFVLDKEHKLGFCRHGKVVNS